MRSFLGSLGRRPLEYAWCEWPFFGRFLQLPDGRPIPPWTIWLVLGGRGAGKTRVGAEWVRALVGVRREII